jgi:hypothetical protein
LPRTFVRIDFVALANLSKPSQVAFFENSILRDYKLKIILQINDFYLEKRHWAVFP